MQGLEKVENENEKVKSLKTEQRLSSHGRTSLISSFVSTFSFLLFSFAGWIAGFTGHRLYLLFADLSFVQLGAQFFHAEAHISTQPAPSFESTRLPEPYEDEGRPGRTIASPGQGAQARLREAGLSRLVQACPGSKQSARADSREHHSKRQIPEIDAPAEAR